MCIHARIVLRVFRVVVLCMYVCACVCNMCIHTRIVLRVFVPFFQFQMSDVNDFSHVCVCVHT